MGAYNRNPLHVGDFESPCPQVIEERHAADSICHAVCQAVLEGV
jgi:hypothetical protein